MARLSSEQAYARAEKMRADWDAEKYTSYTDIANAYGVVIQYARNIILKNKCYRADVPGKENREWKHATVYGVNYGVFKDGRIWSFSKNAFLNPSVDGGYQHFALDVNGKKKKVRVHRLILTVWKRPPNPGEITRHLDDVKTNNHIDNLEWGYEQNNTDDMRVNGGLRIGEGASKAKLTEKQVRKFYKGYRGQCEVTTYARDFIAKNDLDISTASLLAILNGKYWNHVTKHKDGALKVSHDMVRRIRRVYEKNKHRGTLDEICQRFSTHLATEGHDLGWVWIKKIARGELMTHVKP